MAPRSKPRASKKKVASRSPAEMVLREEILGRVFDFLVVDEITKSAAVCKQFDAALPRVTCLTTMTEALQKGPGLVVWQRLANVKHVKFDVHDMDLKCFFANVARGGKQLLSAKLQIYHTAFLEDDEDGINLEEFGRDLSGFARALKRGCLPNLDHFTITRSSNAAMSTTYPDLESELDAFYLALPARAAVAAVIKESGKVELLRRILDENDLDINAVDSLGHTPLSLWCLNTVSSRDDDDSMASKFNELVSRGANVNQVRYGFSPCAMAAASGYKTHLKLRLLLEANASDSRTPPTVTTLVSF